MTGTWKNPEKEVEIGTGKSLASVLLRDQETVIIERIGTIETVTGTGTGKESEVVIAIIYVTVIEVGIVVVIMNATEIGNGDVIGLEKGRGTGRKIMRREKWTMTDTIENLIMIVWTPNVTGMGKEDVTMSMVTWRRIPDGMSSSQSMDIGALTLDLNMDIMITVGVRDSMIIWMPILIKTHMIIIQTMIMINTIKWRTNTLMNVPHLSHANEVEVETSHLTTNVQSDHFPGGRSDKNASLWIFVPF